MTRSASIAAAGYLAMTLVFTWPLAARLASGVPGSWNAALPGVWTMATVSQHLTNVLTGRWSSVASFWEANIFFPAPTALLYSAHLTGSSLLTLPIWWITGNGLLAFNIAVIASFVLTAFATFALTRALTGGVLAPLVTGLFALFILTELPAEHVSLDLLSLQWLPLTLLSWHRFVERGTWTMLALTVSSAWLLNASSTGYMWACLPVLLAFAVLDIAAQGRLRHLDRWIGLGIAVPATALLSAPFILPIADLERQGLLTGAVLGSGGIGAVSAGARLINVLVIGAAALIGLLFAVRRHPTIARADVWVMLALIAVALVARSGAFGAPPSLVFSLAVIGWLVTLPAAVGLRAIEEGRRGTATVALAAVPFLFLSWHPPEGTATAVTQPPFGTPVVEPPPAYLEPSVMLPPIYRVVQSLPSDAVLVELPFGNAAYELRYMYFSSLHRRRLMNGYGDSLPPSYPARVRVLTNPLLDPEQSARAIGGATHVVVHGRAWSDDTGVRIARWVESIGGRLVPTGGDALLYQVQASERFASRQ